MEYNKYKIGERISKERSNRGMTQQELVDKCHEITGLENPPFTVRTLGSWENGNDSITLKNLILISQALECSVGYLLGEYDKRTLEIEDICNATGLSEDATRVLLDLQESKHQSLRNKEIQESNRIKRYFGRHELFLNMFLEESAHLLSEVTDMKECFEKIVKAKENPYFHMIDNAMKENKHFIESAVQIMYEDVEEIERWREDSVREKLKEKYGKTEEEIEEIYKETDGFFVDCFRYEEMQKYQQYDIEQSFMDIVKAYVKEGAEDGGKDKLQEER